MFGYVNVYGPELKMKDFYKYKAYYCGLCKILHEKYGRAGQMTLSYDMTFLIVLLNSLYETQMQQTRDRCIRHPVKPHDTLCNEITEYVADMNIALTYYHLLDDWQDEKSLAGLAGAKILKKDFQKINSKYPRQCGVIRESLDRLRESEEKGETNLDIVSRCFGELMAEIFVYRQDMWEENLRKTGFYLGKFIYLLDAYDDLEKDIKNNSYNPLISIRDEDDFEEKCEDMLTMMMAEATREFEKLPCLVDIDILRNVLYVGVWSKLKDKRKEQLNDSKSI
ncbi:DUF5685 family protein [Parasporobacterium paucivorans]|uniref:Uncharacterized protein n=1 Tax=Parasporobacterium paucivorans DSM 15970 TaxID=1122934 RepID=A0A1M6GJC4_9FIRM|nr:DUF5685 family protein [Parasporobacterium paucivorans]SHJ10022.1 hypothetical protein SAMN02745691_01341 [Parasporobacterium paucivorans DSM 15970]